MDTEHAVFQKGRDMYFTGFADEASTALDAQIKVTKELGWQNIESRKVQVEGFPASA